MIDVSSYEIALGGAGSAFLIALSTFPARSPLAKRLDGFERIDEKSLAQRAVAIERVVGRERTNRLQRRLIEAGWYGVTPLAMMIRTFGALGIGVTVALAVVMSGHGGALGALIAIFSALVAWRIPAIVLARAVRARKEQIQRELPDFLDLLASTVQAGLALNAALLQATDAASGALRTEFDATLAEIRLGRSRADALTAMADRINEESTTTMVTAIVQAERLGSNLSEVLQELARETRDRRWMRAEEKAAQLPVKMIVPMALFMIPSLYLMIFGPVIARVVLTR